MLFHNQHNLIAPQPREKDKLRNGAARLPARCKLRLIFHADERITKKYNETYIHMTDFNASKQFIDLLLISMHTETQIQTSKWVLKSLTQSIASEKQK